MFRSLAPPGAALFLVALLSAGCDDPPEREMHQAEGAIDAARVAGAPAYAAAELRAAEAALQKSQAAVTERDYRQALSAALDARELAREAARAASENRARARSEVDQLLVNTQAALERAEAALAGAVEARVPAAQLEAGRKAIASARTSLQQARATAEASDYTAASARVEGVAATLDRIRSEIDAATLARANRRPGRRSGR